MSDDYSEARLRFACIFPEFARPDFRLPSEETIKRLAEPEGAAPRNSEYYKSLVVDIESYTKHALKLQLAIIEAESQLENARQKHLEVVSHLKDLLEKRRKAATAVDDARVKLEEHLNVVRETYVTLRGGCHE